MQNKLPGCFLNYGFSLGACPGVGALHSCSQKQAPGHLSRSGHLPWTLLYENYYIFFSLLLAPNTGVYLRFQQIWAMFVKKFYISLRAYGFLISQLFFPVFFVIFANVLAISIPNDTGPEPKRALTLDNSALFVDNLTLFYAQFGNISIYNTSDSEPFIFSVSQYRLYRCGITPFNTLLLSGVDIIRI